MGTRHLIQIIIDDEVKVGQYGQWDGYFEAQGQTIADFFKGLADKSKFKEAVQKCYWLSDEEIEALNATNGRWETTHPWLSRDAGANILDMILENDGVGLINHSDFKSDSSCEYSYVINLDNDTITVEDHHDEYPAIPIDAWTKELIDDINENKKEGQIAMIKNLVVI